MLEGAGSRAVGCALLLDLLGGVALVPGLPRRPTDLANAVLVSRQANSLVRRCAGPAATCALVAAAFRSHRTALAAGENPTGAHRRRR